MHSLKIKTTCGENHFNTTLAHPTSPLGDTRKSSVQIRQINNIPDEVKPNQVIMLFDRTCDITWLGGKAGRKEFDFSELGVGKIIR